MRGGPRGRVALELDGVDDYVKIDRDGAWNSLDRELTIAAWVYKRSSERKTMSLVTRQVGTSEEDLIYFGFLEKKPVFAFRTENGVQGVLEEVPFPTETWTHVAVTYDGSVLNLYQNGKRTRSNPMARGSLGKETNPVILGGNENTAGDAAQDSFAGRIARVRIYRRALSAAEVADLAENDR